MKLILSSVFAVAFVSVAFAAETHPHPKALAALGCDPAFIVPIKNDKGDILYWSSIEGKGCPTPKDTNVAVFDENGNLVVDLNGKTE